MDPKIIHMSKNFAGKRTVVNNRQVKLNGNGQALILDSVDKRLLKIVVDDSRLSYRGLARRLGISVGTVIEHLNKLESEGIIENYSAFVNPVKVGYPLTVVIEVIGRTIKTAELDKYIAQLPNVCSVYSVTGRVDTLVIARFRNIEELSTFVRELQKRTGVARTETLLVLNILKEDFRPAID